MNQQSRKQYLSFIIAIFLILGVISLFLAAGYVLKLFEDKEYSQIRPMHTEPMDEETALEGYNNLGISPFTEPLPANAEIVGFDVSDDELILVGYCDRGENKIAVYDSQFCFQTGFAFDYDAAYHVQWNDHNIQIIFVRGSVCLEVRQNGGFVRGCYIRRNDSHNDAFFHDLVKKNTCVVNHVVYRATHGDIPLNLLAGGNYLKLVRIYPDGREEILYDASAMNTVKVLFFAAMIVFVFLFILFRILQENKKNTKSKIG